MWYLLSYISNNINFYYINNFSNLASESSLVSSDEQLNNKNSNDLLGMIFGEGSNTPSNPKPLEKASSSSSNVNNNIE